MRIVLIPGFFGFANFGGLHYFNGVREVLEGTLRGAGLDAQVHIIDALPAATVARRTAHVREQLVALAGGDEGPIHLVGHSTGALDARLLVTPSRERDTDGAMVRRVRSVTSVCGAHRGTPLARSFRTAFGKRLLKTVGTMTVQSLRMGPLSLAGAMAVTGTVSAIDRLMGANDDLLDQIHDGILRGYSPERRAVLEGFFRELAADQGLLDELTPDLAQHFDAQTTDHPRVRYGCVVARARRPTWFPPRERVGRFTPYAQGSRAVFHGLHRLASHSSSDVDVSSHTLLAHLGSVPTLADSDGIVPTHAQLHGRIIDAVEADHHDAIGHFDGPTGHSDWLWSFSRFDKSRFELLWQRVSGFIAAAETDPA
jgi:triacylglycerol lipase